MNNTLQVVGIIAVTVLAAVAISFIVSYPIMILWNECLVPAVPNVKEVTWLQAFGLVILFKALFAPMNWKS